MNNIEFKNRFLRIISLITPSLFFVFTYIFRGNLDKENYGTTIFQIKNESGIKSYFLGYPVYDFGINLGTELPLLSFWNISPIQIVSNVFGIEISWFILIVTSITFLNLQIIRLLDVTIAITKYKALISFILISASPLLIDAFLANDWPAAWLAQVVTMTIWVILYTEIHQLDEQPITSKSIRILSILTLIVVASDPGYLLILLSGIFIILLINITLSKKLFYFKLYRVLDKYIILISWILIALIIFQINILSKNFDTQLREFSNSADVTYKNFFSFRHIYELMPSSSNYLITPLIILVLMYFTCLINNKISRRLILRLSTLLVSSIGFLVLSNLQIPVNESFIPLPTGTFFYRDASYFLIIILAIELVSAVKKDKKISRIVQRLYVPLLLIALLPNLIYVFDGIRNFENSDSKSWLESSIQGKYNRFFYTSGFPQNAGIAFTSLAYDNVRSNPQSIFWMPTDLANNGNRLLTLKTKMQFESEFNQANYLFQSDSLLYDSAFWCRVENRSLYWIEVSIHNYDEETCDNSKIVRYGNLVIEIFDKSFYRDSKEFFKDKSSFVIDNAELIYINRNLELQLRMNRSLPKSSKFDIRIPIKFNSRIRFESKELIITPERDKTGLTNLKLTNFNSLENYEVRISYDPPIIIKLIALNMSFLLLLLFLQILFRLKRSDLDLSSTCARRDLNP